MAQWLSIEPCSKRSLVQFPVRTHAQVVDPIPSGGYAGGGQSIFSLIDVSISLSFSLPLSLKSIKEKKSFKQQRNKEIKNYYVSLETMQARRECSDIYNSFLIYSIKRKRCPGRFGSAVRASACGPERLGFGSR
uniref:Uncharacterized protein n=1 Tax=Molossus molossus TaxID=27622 RepID=A0A7J8JVF1_MOLMO|nr:hypothetical protein HJG59_007875 [Molossus molossus]